MIVISGSLILSVISREGERETERESDIYIEREKAKEKERRENVSHEDDTKS